MTIQIGDLRITPLLDGHLTIRPASLYGAVATHAPVLPGTRGLAETDWDDTGHREPGGDYRMAFGGYLVEAVAAGRVVLVDAGVGPDAPAPAPDLPPPPKGRMLDALDAAGLQPDDVTDVVLTHLHLDHVGWLAPGGQSLIRNAVHRWSAWDDHHLRVRPHELVSACVDPVRGRAATWEDETTLFPGLRLAPAPGHTPGTTIVELTSEGQTVLLLGDVVHTPQELEHHDWAGMGDADPGAAAATRARVRTWMAGTDALASSPHFPDMCFGRLHHAENGSLSFARA